MRSRLMMASGVLACLAGAAHAQTPLPLTNPDFEVVDPFSIGGNQPKGWHNLSNPSEAVFRKLGDTKLPTAIVHGGQRSIMLRPVPATGSPPPTFRGWTTDTINNFDPNLPYFDPVYTWAGGDVVVGGYYAIPASDPISDPGENVGIKLNIKLGNQDYATKDIQASPNITGHTNGQWVHFEVTFTQADIEAQVAANELAGYFTVPPYPDHCKIVIGRFADRPNGITSSGVIFWDDMTYVQQAGVPACPVEYNGDNVLNPDDLGDYITDYFTVPAIPGPGGYAIACPGNSPPYDQGYKAGYTPDGSGQCNLPFPDNLGDYITDYFTGCP